MTAVGDIGSGPDGVATLKAMAASKPDVALGLGDLSYGGPASEEAWCRLVATHLGSTPMQLVSGNHEEDIGEDGRIANFAACLPDRMRSTGRYGSEYYFDVGGLARVIMISPDLTIGGEHYYYGEGNQRVDWLESAIDGARSERIPWVLVGMHKSCLSVGAYDCKIYEELLNVLNTKKVDLVLHAHDHNYQRTFQLGLSDGCSTVRVDSYDPRCVVDRGAAGAHPKGRGTVFVVSGDSSSSRSPPNAWTVSSSARPTPRTTPTGSASPDAPEGEISEAQPGGAPVKPTLPSPAGRLTPASARYSSSVMLASLAR